MFCAISGEVPSEPVVSIKSGHVFEKRLVLAAVASTGKCPVTGQVLSEADVIPLQVNPLQAPRPAPRGDNSDAGGASIPGMLNAFQAEWDAQVLRNHNLQRELVETRQQLATALYQYEAASRVIAKQLQEKEHLQTLLMNGGGAADAEQNSAGASKSSSQTAAAPSSTPSSSGASSIMDRMVEANGVLTNARNSMKKPKNWPSGKKVAQYSLSTSCKPHAPASAEILSIMRHPTQPTFITGATDSRAVVWRREGTSSMILHALQGHSGPVTCTAFAAGSTGDHVAVTASTDGSVKVWSGASCVSTLDGHGGQPVTSLSCHETLPVICTSASDGRWCLWDLNTSQAVTACPTDQNLGKGKVSALHPDGLLVLSAPENAGGSGSHGLIMSDIREAQNKAPTLIGTHDSPVLSLSLSPSGYIAATACESGVVKIWDLRYPGATKASVASLSAPGARHVAYGRYGKFVGVAGQCLDVYAHKKWAAPALRAQSKGTPWSCVSFAGDMSWFAAAAGDEVTFFEQP